MTIRFNRACSIGGIDQGGLSQETRALISHSDSLVVCILVWIYRRGILCSWNWYVEQNCQLLDYSQLLIVNMLTVQYSFTASLTRC